VGLGHLQDPTEAQAALATAAEGENTGVLRAAIAVAQVLGVGQPALAAAAQRLTSLEETERQRDAAEEALLDAVELATGGGSTEALAAALRHAVALGVDEEVLAEATAVLNSREALAAFAAREASSQSPEATALQLEEAEKALALAAAGEDVQALRNAIAQARVVGVGEEMLAEAAEALEVVKELAKAKVDAEDSLINAVAGEHARLLEAAIELAEEAGVAEEAVEAARAKLRSMDIAAEDAVSPTLPEREA